MKNLQFFFTAQYETPAMASSKTQRHSDKRWTSLNSDSFNCSEVKVISVKDSKKIDVDKFACCGSVVVTKPNQLVGSRTGRVIASTHRRVDASTESSRHPKKIERLCRIVDSILTQKYYMDSSNRFYRLVDSIASTR